jgi:hypothetical protein
MRLFHVKHLSGHVVRREGATSAPWSAAGASDGIVVGTNPHNARFGSTLPAHSQADDNDALIRFGSARLRSTEGPESNRGESNRSRADPGPRRTRTVSWRWRRAGPGSQVGADSQRPSQDRLGRATIHEASTAAAAYVTRMGAFLRRHQSHDPRQLCGTSALALNRCHSRLSLLRLIGWRAQRRLGEPAPDSITSELGVELRTRPRGRRVLGAEPDERGGELPKPALCGLVPTRMPSPALAALQGAEVAPIHARQVSNGQPSRERQAQRTQACFT